MMGDALKCCPSLTEALTQSEETLSALQLSDLVNVMPELTSGVQSDAQSHVSSAATAVHSRFCRLSKTFYPDNGM